MIVSEMDSVRLLPGLPDVSTDSDPRPGCDPLKRAADVVVGSLLALISLPVILVSMALVRLTSRGPAIFTQVRLGRDGVPYTIYKLRTMYLDCESETGPVWSTKGDPRVTAVGRVLRATHVDELPQLWNVLKGEMSLVGPRPERPEIARNLEKAIPSYADRVGVLPGLTGLAQVQLPPDATLCDVRRKLACDLYYIRNQGVWLDLRILLSTAGFLLGIPFDLSRAILRIPGGEAVGADDRDRPDGPGPTGGPAGPVALLASIGPVGRPDEPDDRDRGPVAGVGAGSLSLGS